MTDDLIARLKGHSEIMERDKGKFVRFIDVATCTEAIDLIETQAREIERLREALMKIHDEDRRWTTRSRQSFATGDTHYDDVLVLGRYANIARAALEGKQ